jgi:DNA-binding FadR family transcriptional regulator
MSARAREGDEQAPSGSWGARRELKTSERIARALVDVIVDQELPEGAKLPTERELMDTYEVGRATLREAMRLLEIRSVVTIRPGVGGGPMVRRPRAEDLHESLALILNFAGATLQDVFEARASLEPTIALLAAERSARERIDDLVFSVQAMRRSEDPRTFVQENRRFHGVLAAATGSVVLWIFHEALQCVAQGASVGSEFTAARRRAVALEHQQIADAIVDHDGQAAEAAMRAHLTQSGTFWKGEYPQLWTKRLEWLA